MTIRHPSRGFTLIELLVVVAIIGLLATIVIASLSAAQIKARDVRRMSDIDTLRKALALYATNDGLYPVEISPVAISSSSFVGASLVANNALNIVPRDPLDPTYRYEYVSNDIGSTYTISFCLETNTIQNFSQGCGNTISP